MLMGADYMLGAGWLYRLVETAVQSLLTPEGRKDAARIVQEAVSGIPY